jgi:hypothetical protein
MIIGQIVGGGKLELELPTLVDTRLLIQANLGGGKSWLLRLTAERRCFVKLFFDSLTYLPRDFLPPKSWR